MLQKEKNYIYLDNSVLLEHRSWLYILLKLINRYANDVSLSYAEKGRVISNDSVTEIIGQRGEFNIMRTITTKVYESPINGNTCTISFEGLPSTMNAVGPDIGVSRQSLSQFADKIKELSAQGELRLQLGTSYVKYPLPLIEWLIKLNDGAGIDDRNKGLYVMLYMINSVMQFKNNFNKGYDAIGQECDCCKEFVSKIVKKMMDNNILYIKRKGNNLQHMPNSYGLSSDFILKLKEKDDE